MASEKVEQAIEDFRAAADDEGALYAIPTVTRMERKAATARMVEARAALVAAIEAEQPSEIPNQNQLLLIGLLSGAGPQKREQYLEFYCELIRARSYP